MVYLAGCQKKICPLKLISEKEGISFDYLEKIVSKLEKAGLIKAKKGVQGGYSLSKKPSKIKAGEVIRALEGEINLVKCLTTVSSKKSGRRVIRSTKYVCPLEKRCLARNFWKKFQKSMNYVLDSITLADLIGK